MRHMILNIILLLLVSILAACTTITNRVPTQQSKPTTDIDTSGPGTPAVQNTPELTALSDSSVGGTSIGGAIEQAMDESDKSKMLHAMDRAPGKSTHWMNANTEIDYTVTPVRKVNIENNSYCRQYQMIAVDANEREQNMQGVACIAADGNWHIMQK